MQLRILFATFLLMAGIVTSVEARQTIAVHTGVDTFRVDVFRQRQEAGRPALIVLSGSKGLDAAAYDEIGAKFMAAGFDVYLPHLLSQEDLTSIASAKDSQSRIEYYNEHRRRWLGNLRAFVAMLHSQGYKGNTGLLGISLGAETAALATSDGLPVDAAVLVAGVPSAQNDFKSSETPLHLIWGSVDSVYPLSKAQEFEQLVEKAGGTATMTVFEGASHDFFLEPASDNALKAYDDAIEFLKSHLSN